MFPFYTFCFLGLMESALSHHARAPALSTRDTNSNDLVARGLEALGLSSTNVSQVNTVTYVGAGLYRTKGVMESYAMVQDVFAATAGSYNISFSYESPQIKQRINAHHQISRPFSAYAIREAEKISPLLLSKISSNQNFTLGQKTISTGVTLPSVHDNVLDLSVIFDPESHLPLIIRALDYHPLFGLSTYDLLLNNYTRVNGTSYPTRFQTILNNKHLIMDYEVRQVLVNPSLNTATFEGPADRSLLQPPVADSLYNFGEIATWSESYMWYGGWVRTTENYTFTQPVSDLPGLWYMDPRPNPPSYKQVILEFEDSVVILDASPHQSLVIIDWVQKTLGRNVTHVWPTHHHGDHAMGLIDYATAGAKVIVLDQAKDYYIGIPEDSILTYTTEELFSMGDSNMHAKFIHMDNSVHAFDHSYAVITPSCVNDNSSVVVSDADHLALELFDVVDQSWVMDFVTRLAEDRVAYNAQIFSAHMFLIQLPLLIETFGLPYPKYSPSDFKYGSSSCPNNGTASW